MNKKKYKRMLPNTNISQMPLQISKRQMSLVCFLGTITSVPLKRDDY